MAQAMPGEADPEVPSLGDADSSVGVSMAQVMTARICVNAGHLPDGAACAPRRPRDLVALLEALRLIPSAIEQAAMLSTRPSRVKQLLAEASVPASGRRGCPSGSFDEQANAR